MFDKITSKIDDIKKDKKRAKDEAKVKSKIKKTELHADLTMERKQLKGVIGSEVSQVTYSKITPIEKQVAIGKIKDAYLAIVIIDEALKIADDNYFEDSLDDAVSRMDKSLSALAKTTKSDEVKRIRKFSKKALNTEEDSKFTKEIQDLIIRLSKSENMTTVVNCLLEGQNIESVIDIDESIHIKTEIQSALIFGSAYSKEDDTSPAAMVNKMQTNPEILNAEALYDKIEADMNKI